jgi:hypothetical protein
MPEQDFELYLSLLSRFLRLKPAQRDEIADELRDHLEERLRSWPRGASRAARRSRRRSTNSATPPSWHSTSPRRPTSAEGD